jgi:hypothetical protein
MEFRVACECGRAVSVPGGAAGTAVPCPCGRAIRVPSLRQLRQAAAGDPAGERPPARPPSRPGRPC